MTILYLNLFLSFMKIGFLSFGGMTMIPIINEEVLKFGWMTTEEVLDIVAIAEMTPGPISINSSTFVGMRLSGPFGVILCTLGCIIPSFIICLTLAHFYYKYRSFEGVQTVLGALRPAVVALIASAGLSSCFSDFSSPESRGSVLRISM